MERRGVGKRLTDGQRVEIIKLFESGAAVTEADIARRYGVTRSAIWRLRRASSQIMERYQEGDIESRDERRRGPSASSSAASTAQSTSTVAATAAMTSANMNALARGVLMDGADGQLAAAMSDNAAFQGINMGLARPMAGPVGGNMMPNGASNGINGAEMVMMPGVDASALSVVPGVSAPQPTGTASSAARKTTTPAATAAVVADTTLPLVYLSVKAIGSVQSPGILNWERVNGAHDEEHFEIVNDGLSVRREGNYQINVDLQHSQPRQNFRFTFKVWHGKKLLGQCSCPLRTKKEISLSVLELRCRLPVLAKLRVEFLAPGFAFHESRATIRLLP